MKAVLLINIGSPESYQSSDVQTYLNQFLMDKNVINLPYLFRWLLMKKIIIPKRAPKSAKAYKSIWTKEGSPLLVFSQKLIDRINESSESKDYKWFSAMRYSKPSIEQRLKEIQEEGFEEIILFPAYPQFAYSSTWSCIEEVRKSLKKIKKQSSWNPKVSYIQDFFQEPNFINAIADKAKSEVQNFEDYEHYLFSYHGLPENHMPKKSKDCGQCSVVLENNICPCYKAQCYATTEKVAKALNIPKEKYSVSFQSRLGPSKWIEPYTDIVVKNLAKKGIKSLAVFSLSFITDCLETLEELDIRLKEDFISHGGKNFHRFKCLNEDFLSIQNIITNSAIRSLNKNI